MMGMADLLAVAVINDGLQHLSRNPFHLEFILGAFTREPLQSIVGVEHIKQCIDFVTKNRIHVAPFYQLDIKRRPAIGVISSGREEQQYIGDYGTTANPNNQDMILPPRIYSRFDAVGVTSDLTGLLAANAFKLSEKMWPGQIVTNDQFTSRVTGILPGSSTSPDTIFVADALPADVRLSGWRTQSQRLEKGIICNASTDLVTIQLKLTTTGDMGVHRLLAIVLRYCLKRGRLLFDQYGLQVATFSFTPMAATDETEAEFESTATIEAKYTDLWIEREFDLSDSTKKLVMDLDAVPGEPVEGREIVDVGEEPTRRTRNELE